MLQLCQLAFKAVAVGHIFACNAMQCSAWKMVISFFEKALLLDFPKSFFQPVYIRSWWLAWSKSEPS